MTTRKDTRERMIRIVYEERFAAQRGSPEEAIASDVRGWRAMRPKRRGDRHIR